VAILFERNYNNTSIRSRTKSNSIWASMKIKTNYTSLGIQTNILTSNVYLIALKIFLGHEIITLNGINKRT
jgi:hypothetical protein